MKRVFLFAAAYLMAAPAMAKDGIYYGLGVSVTRAESSAITGSPPPFTSNATIPSVGGTIGYAWPSEHGSIALEADLDLALSFGSVFEYHYPCTTSATSEYYCQQKATLRVRSVLERSFGKFDGMFSIGAAAMFGEGAIGAFATDNGSNVGLTASIGIVRGPMRYELIYDDLGNTIEKPAGVFTPDYKAISFKAVYFFQ